MGSKYYVCGRLSGYCSIWQESKTCKTFLGCIVSLIIFRLKYPIVDVQVRNGYKDCDKCNLGENKPLCYSSRKGQ